MFGGSRFTILPNAFDIAAFSFDQEARLAIRKRLGIDEGTVVLGNVARLNPEKNHAFLIEVFERFRELVPSSALIIAGGGSGETRVKGLVESSPGRDAILLLGNVANPAKLYSAMDCFVFPSNHEGLGIVLVEAQLSGLPCLVSEGIPRSAAVSDAFHALALQSGANVWAEEISALLAEPRKRIAGEFDDPRAKAFDINNSYPILEFAYRKALARRCK